MSVLLIVTLVPLLCWSVLEALIVTVISEPIIISSLQRVMLEIKVFGDEATNSADLRKP